MWRCWISEIRSSFRQLVSLSKSSSSPVSACFPSSSTFSVLTALFICSSLVCACIHPLTSVLAVTTLTPHFSPCFEFVHAFVYLHPSHTPFASSSPGSADHLPSSMCSMSVSTFILPHLLYSYPPFNVSIDLRWWQICCLSFSSGEHPMPEPS